MIRHIVTITLKDDAPTDEIEAFFELLSPISRHPKAIDYYCGFNFQDLGDRCDIAISCAFETRADFDDYMASPDHSPPGAVMNRIATHWSVVDFDEDSPQVAKAQSAAWTPPTWGGGGAERSSPGSERADGAAEAAQA